MSWEGQPRGQTELAGYWWVLAYASQSDWAHSQFAGSALAVAASDACPGHRALAPGRIGRLSRPHRGAPPVSIYAALIGRTPNRYGRAHTQAAGRIPRPHRELSRYLCQLRDWAQAQSYAAVFQQVVGRTSATGLCNYAPFTEAGRTPRPSVATWAPSMPMPPRKRLRDLPSWSGPMAIAGILPK